MKNFKKYLPRIIVAILIACLIVSPVFIRLPEKTNKEIAVAVVSDLLKTSLQQIIPGKLGENVSILSERVINTGIDKATSIFGNIKDFLKNRKEKKQLEFKNKQKVKEKNEFRSAEKTIEPDKEETYRPVTKKITDNLRRIFIDKRIKEN
jgi:hypothetical protein